MQLFNLESLKGQVAFATESSIYQGNPATFYFYKEMTALLIIQKRLGKTPHYANLEKICVAKGGRSSSRVTHIRLGEEYRSYEISHKQCEKFATAFDIMDLIAEKNVYQYQHV